jgi:hypothetical protein
MYNRSQSNNDDSQDHNENVWVPLTPFQRARLAEHAALYALQIGRPVSPAEYFTRLLYRDMGRNR